MYISTSLTLHSDNYKDTREVRRERAIEGWSLGVYRKGNDTLTMSFGPYVSFFFFVSSFFTNQISI